jgi:hypothetical protein
MKINCCISKTNRTITLRKLKHKNTQVKSCSNFGNNRQYIESFMIKDFLNFHRLTMSVMKIIGHHHKKLY